MDAFRKPIRTAWAGEEFEEEVFVLGIERPQALRDDSYWRWLSYNSVSLITPARKFRMLLHTNPTRERGECLGTRVGASEDM
jgi:hypothetical protein